LTFWSPNINIFRDPRWGRGHETYGEDPLLTARMGVAFVRGLQGDDPRILKLVATPKHFAVHSGREKDRHRFNAEVSGKDLHETYLPAFEACIREGKAHSVMGAYNRTNGEACCASPTLLGKILREAWGFSGYVVSDCWAIIDLYKHHKLVETPEEAAAMAVKAGCDLNCGCTYPALVKAVAKGLITEAEIDVSVKRLFAARFRLGMFDPDESVPFAQIPMAVNDCEEHRGLALDAARASIVLLKNEGGLLPLSKDLKTVAVIGPNADEVLSLKGNYFGTASRAVTPLAGIQDKLPDARIRTAKGCDLIKTSEEGFAHAVQVAKNAEVAVVVLGLNATLEEEEGETVKSSYTDGGDRTRIDLPGDQEGLLKAVHATGTPVVLVLLNGSALAVNWAKDNVPAMVEAWYPGEEGGTALADVLFGDANPGGRLPVTFYRSHEDLPPFEAYAMEGRTYRYFRGEVLFPFGFGLSFTKFRYTGLQVSPNPAKAGEAVEVRVTVVNAGDRAGDEVIQLYVSAEGAPAGSPLRSLADFARVHLAAGEKRAVTLRATGEALSRFDEEGRRRLEPGRFTVAVGGCQPGYDSLFSVSTEVLTAPLEVTGPAGEKRE
ncbi:MAG: glycoside hydrolase family 3 C-terminal domain-containing protein, partial [Planctomycetota bacterium]